MSIRALWGAWCSRFRARSSTISTRRSAGPRKTMRPEPEVASEEEEDEFDLSSIELPEGVTLR